VFPTKTFNEDRFFQVEKELSDAKTKLESQARVRYIENVVPGDFIEQHLMAGVTFGYKSPFSAEKPGEHLNFVLVLRNVLFFIFTLPHTLEWKEKMSPFLRPLGYCADYVKAFRDDKCDDPCQGAEEVGILLLGTASGGMQMNRISHIQGDLIVVPVDDLKQIFSWITGSRMVVGLKRL